MELENIELKQKFDCKYIIDRKISEGNFGVVFQGYLESNRNFKVAIKKIFSSRQNKKQRETVEREIIIYLSLQKKQKNRNIVQMLDYKVKETSVSIVLEYMEMDLHQIIKQNIYPLESSLIKSIIYQIMKGIQQLHNNRILHRDLKPQNILINEEGVVKIGDLGSAVFMDHQFQIEGFSRWYKAPELLMGSKSYDYQIDLWSLGCVAGELINGVPLFPGINEIDQLARICDVLGIQYNILISILFMFIFVDLFYQVVLVSNIGLRSRKCQIIRRLGSSIKSIKEFIWGSCSIKKIEKICRKQQTILSGIRIEATNLIRQFSMTSSPIMKKY